MNYSSLIASKADLNSIKGWVNHELTPSEQIVVEAEAKIYTQLRVREMRVLAVGAIAMGGHSFPLPTGFITSRRLRVSHPTTGPVRLDHLPEHDFEDMLAINPSDGLPYDGPPTFFTTDATNALINTKAEVALTYRWWITAQPAILSVANKTNFLTDKYPHILGAMCRHLALAYWRRSDESAYWLEIAMQGIEAANAKSDDEFADIHCENNHA